MTDQYFKTLSGQLHQLLTFKGEHRMDQVGQQLEGWGNILFHGGNTSTNKCHMWAKNMTNQYIIEWAVIDIQRSTLTGTNGLPTKVWVTTENLVGATYYLLGATYLQKKVTSGQQL